MGDVGGSEGHLQKVSELFQEEGMVTGRPSGAAWGCGMKLLISPPQKGKQRRPADGGSGVSEIGRSQCRVR